MKIVQEAFEKLESAETIDDVDNILSELKIDRSFHMKDSIYPKIDFKITKEEIINLKKRNFIKDDNSINNISNTDPLTKLLYSVLWKNGDLSKIKHIIEGIISEKKIEKDNGIVFYQFGKYLTKKSGEPIIDQHVLRAFGMYKANGDEQKINHFTRLSIITKEHKHLIDDYKSWLQNDLKKELREQENYAYHIDKVLFAIGKMNKSKNKNIKK